MGTTDQAPPEIERVTEDELKTLSASLFGPLLTFDEARQVLKVGRNTLGRYINNGTLPAIEHARRIYIPREAVARYMDDLHIEAEQRRAARAAKKRPRARNSSAA